MTVLKYSEYQGLFGDLCKIPEPGFDMWVIRSIAEINRYITAKVELLGDHMAKLCILEVAECLYDANECQGIASENTDGYSVSYDGKKAEIYPIIKRYLNSYLYRGVDL